MAKNEKSNFAVIGEGIEYAVEGQTLHLRVSLDAAKGRPSATGKMVLTGTTSGWQLLPAGDGVRLNVMVGRRTGA